MSIESKEVRHGARELLRHRVVCDECGWTSHQYNQKSTAEVIFAEHQRTTCTKVPVGV